MYDRKILDTPEGPTPDAAPRPAAPPAWPRVDVIGTLRRRRTGLIACALAGVAAAAGFGTLASPRFAASTKIIVDPSDLRIVDKGLREQATFGDAQIAQVENEVRVLTSTSVLGAVVDAQHLDQDPEFAARGRSMLAGLREAVGVPRKDPEPEPRLDAMRALAKDVAVRREERTYVVEIVVTTRDAAKSVRLADAIVAAFLTFSADQHTEATRRVATSLQDRLSELRQSVETAEQKVVDYKQRNDIVAAIGQSVTEQQLADANTRLVEGRKRVEELRSRRAQVVQAQRVGDGGAIPDALQSATVATLRSQLAQVIRRGGNLAATLGPRHPDAVQVRSEERSLRALLAEELRRIATVAASDLARAEADEAAARSSFDALKAAVTSTSQSAVRLRELEREVEANRTVYEAFLVRAREVAGQEQINPADVRVISAGQALEGRTWPPRPTVLAAAGAALGLGLGFVLALLLGVADAKRFERPPQPGAASVRPRHAG